MKDKYSLLIDELVQVVVSTFQENKQSITTNLKEKHDYVTNVDLAIERVVIELINSRYPSHQVIGEESVPEFIDFSQPTWLIDPLDGTSNFVFDIPFYGFSIAFILDNQVQAALIIDLASHEVFTAFRGGGAYLNSKRLYIKDNQSDFIGISSGFVEQAAIQAPDVLLDIRKQGKFRLLGAQALHLCYVAAGRLKACINYEAKVWDDIAGALIVEEAGGRYSSKASFNTCRISSIKSDQNLMSIAEGGGTSLIAQLASRIALH